MFPAWNPLAGRWCGLVDRVDASVGHGPGLRHLKSEREEQVLVPLDEIRALLC